MSLSGYKSTISLNDTVILYLSNNIYTLVVEEKIRNKNGQLVENVFQTPFGALKVKNLIGVEYGSKVELSRGWCHVLQPTPELWTLCLPHRTQIVYTPDISMILAQLDLEPGKIVIEAGTGSGSLTHALIRRVRPEGHIYTFDFHQMRCQLADTEFKVHGLDDVVTVRQRDVLENGFGDDLDGRADAVFLDLPKPWLGVQFAKRALKQRKGGRFAAFSPCIEQVQRTVQELKNHGFQDIITIEVLQTEIKVQERTVTMRNLSFLKDRIIHHDSHEPDDDWPSDSDDESSQKDAETNEPPLSQPGDDSADNKPGTADVSGVSSADESEQPRSPKSGDSSSADKLVIDESSQPRTPVPECASFADISTSTADMPLLDEWEQPLSPQLGYSSSDIDLQNEEDQTSDPEVETPPSPRSPPTPASGTGQEESANPVEEKAGEQTKMVVGSYPTSTAGHTGFLTFATLPSRKRRNTVGGAVRMKNGKLYICVGGRKRFKIECFPTEFRATVVQTCYEPRQSTSSDGAGPSSLGAGPSGDSAGPLGDNAGPSGDSAGPSSNGAGTCSDAPGSSNGLEEAPSGSTCTDPPAQPLWTSKNIMHVLKKTKLLKDVMQTCAEAIQEMNVIDDNDSSDSDLDSDDSDAETDGKNKTNNQVNTDSNKKVATQTYDTHSSTDGAINENRQDNADNASSDNRQEISTNTSSENQQEIENNSNNGTLDSDEVEHETIFLADGNNRITAVKIKKVVRYTDN